MVAGIFFGSLLTCVFFSVMVVKKCKIAVEKEPKGKEPFSLDGFEEMTEAHDYQELLIPVLLYGICSTVTGITALVSGLFLVF